MKYLPGVIVVLATAAMGVGGCSAAKDLENASKGCDGLDVAVQAQAVLKGYADAAAKLKGRALEVEAKFLAVCNAMNGDLGLDTSKTTAADACAVLKARIDQAAAAGVTVTMEISANCSVDVNAQATCEADCAAKVNCDVTAKCEPGKLVVACMGSCSGSCDVKAPSFDCMGTCQGTCTATAAVACSGSCSGTCDGPTISGTCDAGCSANFKGTCEGMCMGMCNGTASTGTCMGTCQGTCTGKATGSCDAKCTGMVTNAKCMGMCAGSCTADAAVSCTGKCDGTCSYTPGTATCNGECHGSCTAQASPPRCEGTLDCMGTVDCRGNCSANVKANIDCSTPKATVTVAGDAKLQSVIEAHLTAWAEAVSLALQLKDPIAEFAGKTIAAFSAIGDVGLSGAACFASGFKVAGEASASISVSVSASASVSTN